MWIRKMAEKGGFIQGTLSGGTDKSVWKGSTKFLPFDFVIAGQYGSATELLCGISPQAGVIFEGKLSKETDVFDCYRFPLYSLEELMALSNLAASPQIRRRP